MTAKTQELVTMIYNHRCYVHPVFLNWARVSPSPQVIGALFRQIQCFCAATRPGGNMPEALATIGLARESKLIQEIVDSEEDHGPELATMAGYIINRAAEECVIDDLYDQPTIEQKLKACSDEILGGLPGYDRLTGLTVQARQAIAVFDTRKAVDAQSTYRNLGVALALEIISNRHLIPGEKHCLVDSGLYGAAMDQPEMHYLDEHWGEVGAEQQHEQNAIAAVDSILTDENELVVVQGAEAFLDSLANFWDLLDSSLLQSGYAVAA